MAVSLTKGGNVNLTKLAPGLSRVKVGLGWDKRQTDGSQFDLDTSIFMLNEFGKVNSDGEFVFFNNPKSPCGSVTHGGDNRTGEGEGDDESASISLNAVPATTEKVTFAVTIYDAEERRQNFGMVNRAYIRVVNEDNNEELARYDLSEDMSIETAMIFGEVYRNNGEWKFKAVGQGYAGGLKSLAENFGVNV